MYSNSNEGNETGIGEYSDLSDFLKRNKLSSIFEKLKENDWTLKLLAEIELNDIPDLVRELQLPLLTKSKLKLAIKTLKEANQRNSNNSRFNNTKISLDREHQVAIAELMRKVDQVMDIENKLKQMDANQTCTIDEYQKNYLRLIDENKELMTNYFNKVINKYVQLETIYVQTLLVEHAKVSQNIIGLNEANDLLQDYLLKGGEIDQALKDEEQKQDERSNSVVKLRISVNIMSNDTRDKISDILASVKPINDKLKDTDSATQQLNIINTNLDYFKDKLLKVGDNITIKSSNNSDNITNNDDEMDKFETLDYIVDMFKLLLDENKFTSKYIEFYKKSKNENVSNIKDLENNNNNNEDEKANEAPKNEENNQNNEGQIEQPKPVENPPPEQPQSENNVAPPVEQPKQPEPVQPVPVQPDPQQG